MGWKLKQKPVQPWAKLKRQELFHMWWRNRFPGSLPEPGAQAYSWESLGLVEFSPIGPTAVAGSLDKVSKPYLVGQAVPIYGMPTQAGGIIGQPLVDPTTGGPTVNPMEPAYPMGGPNNPHPM